MRKMRNSKCPACGYESQPGNKRTFIRDMVWKRDKFCQRLLKEALNKISVYVLSDSNDDKRHKFLWGIKEVPDDIIKWATNIYLKEKHYKQGKGLAFLKAMIYNHQKDRKVLEDSELRKLGRTPKSITEKRKELGYE